MSRWSASGAQFMIGDGIEGSLNEAEDGYKLAVVGEGQEKGSDAQAGG